GLLADDAALQRDLLVDDPPAVAADPDGGEHVVGAGEGLGRVGRHLDHAGVAEHPGQLGGQPADRVAAPGVGLEGADLVEGARPGGQHGPHERGHPDSAATQDRQLHSSVSLSVACIPSIPTFLFSAAAATLCTKLAPSVCPPELNSATSTSPTAPSWLTASE